MSKSYEDIHYVFRPRKQIERKIIIESLQNLSYLDTPIDISDYHYFGFGSIYYADFKIFHKYLNINNMTSIDKQIEDKKRFVYNKPYNFITFESMCCSEFIRKNIDWDEKQLMWYDSEPHLNETIVNNIYYLANNLKVNDIILITINGEKPKNTESFLEKFDDFIPQSKKNEKYVKLNYLDTLREILLSSINDGLTDRGDRLEFLQLFNFKYRDTSKMYTFGGIFCEKDSDLKEKIKDKLNMPTISFDKNIIDLNCPLLTYKEKLELDSYITKEGAIREEENFEEIGLNEEQIKTYTSFYKYYPQFFESLY